MKYIILIYLYFIILVYSYLNFNDFLLEYSEGIPLIALLLVSGASINLHAMKDVITAPANKLLV
jgi:hypothetical protein